MERKPKCGRNIPGGNRTPFEKPREVVCGVQRAAREINAEQRGQK
jgi:hypothetical protein